MRNTYAVEYPLSESPEPAEVARLWHAWLTDRRDSPPLPKVLKSDPAQDLALTDMGDGHTLEQIRVDANGVAQFALRWEHPDSRARGVRWRSELAFVSAQGDRRAHFSCKLAFGRSTAKIAPTRRQITRPKVVVSMLRKFPGVEHEMITHKPLVLRPTDVGRFAGFLASEERKRPVVLVSCRNLDDQPAVNPNRVAELLGGLAFVYVTEGRWPTLALRDHLPKHLICRDGAVRIYWPGFAVNGSGSGHPFWTPFDSRSIAEEREGGLPQVLLESIVEAAVYTAGTHLADWQRFESERRRIQISASRAAGDFEALAESYATDNVALEERVHALEENLGSASDALRQARNDVTYWRGMYETERASAKVAAVESEPEVSSVADALDRVLREHRNKIVVSLNSASDRDTPFSAPDEVYESLCFLATTFHDSKTGAAPCTDLNHSLRERTGWFYEAHQAATTLGKYRSEYECSWDSRRHILKAHMGTGTSKDPRHSIRVAFAWDDKKKVVVIGYVGQHQSNDKTS